LDKIFIRDLLVQTRVGITEKERRRKQGVIIDIFIFRDLSPAGTTDDPEKTLSYSQINDDVLDYVSNGEFKLLEGMAEGIASILLKNRAVMKVRVKVRKKKYTARPSIGIEITRTPHG
jgi:FolB domain-containing protein